MSNRKQLAQTIEQSSSVSEETIELDIEIKPIVLEDYKDLNVKCDSIIKKIRIRKTKKK